MKTAEERAATMKLPRRQCLYLAAGAIALSAVSRIATAQTYPERAVRVIVPFPPGGATDVFARPVAQKLSEQLGKQFYVDNVGGASGNIGMGQAARAKPDGYSILFAFSSYVTNPSLFNKVPYDPYKDFEPVTLAVAALGSESSSRPERQKRSSPRSIARSSRFSPCRT